MASGGLLSRPPMTHRGWTTWGGGRCDPDHDTGRTQRCRQGSRRVRASFLAISRGIPHAFGVKTSSRGAIGRRCSGLWWGVRLGRDDRLRAVSGRIRVEKQGRIGWLVFDHPERRNAISVDMWSAIPEAAQDLAGGRRGARRRPARRGRDRLRVGGRHLGVREPPHRWRGRRLRPGERPRGRRPAAAREAGARHDPRLLPGRRRGRLARRRPALRGGRRGLRHPGGAARGRLRHGRDGGARERGGPLGGQGDLLHRAPLPRR